MSPLFGHILAQVVSLSVGDRTEGRYIASDPKYYEAATYVRAGLSLGWKHTTVNVGYAPSFTVTPLDSSSRDLLIFHSAAIAGIYNWQHTTVSLSQSVGIGQLNFRTQGLGDPRALAPAATTPDVPGGTPAPTGGATPGTPPATGNTGTGSQVPANQTANQIRATDQVVTFVTSVTAADVTQRVSSVLSVSAGLGYIATGSVGSGSSVTYPVVRGPRALVSADYQFTRHDDAVSVLTAQYAGVSGGNDSWIFATNESWTHVFSTRTNSRLGVGVSASRTAQPDGLVAWSIYPTFISSISHSTKLDRSLLSLSLTASSSPTLDPVRATVDPRLNLGASAGWSLDRFSTGLGANTALSLVDANKTGSLSSVAGFLFMGYALGKNVGIDSGVRAFWQNYEGAAVVPLTWAAFVGITVAAATTPR